MAMGSGQMLQFPILIILIHFANITTAQVPDFLYSFCTNSANYTRNSTYQTNLNTLLSSLPSNTSNNYGFYNTSAGQDLDTVNTITLCRGDVSREICRDCISDATLKLREVCPNQKEAIGWYDECMLRYSNASIFHTVGQGDVFFMWNANDVSSFGEFYAALRNLMDRLQAEAAAGGSLRKFSTGSIAGPDFLRIYGLMQCTPDLSEAQCRNCLYGSTAQIHTCCNGKQGGRVVRPSCNLRYEISSFYDEIPAISLPSPPPPPSQSPPPPAGKSDNVAPTVILIASLTISVVILVTLVCIFMGSRKKKQALKQTESEDYISTTEFLQYNFCTISAATDNFSEDNKLGQGGFGSVYKGRLPNGKLIAVKRLSTDSRQGKLEFKNEVLLVARLQHKNLVRLLGFCLEGPEQLLIYEFVSNASLDQFLFDSTRGANLNWDQRYKIIEGVARGLLYLHEDSRLKIIHRDLKASNILLDADMNAKIADFGMARLFTPDETQGNTSRIVGTYGYMAPEYAMHGQFSVKSDVFSFGVLILEIVPGQKNQSFQTLKGVEDLLSYAWKTWREGTASNMIDPTLRAGSGGSMRDIIRTLHIGLLCVQESAADRPTMAMVVLMLCSLSLTIPVPSEPAFFMHSSINPDVPLLEEYYSSSKSKSGSFHSLVKKKLKHDIHSWVSL